MQTLSDELDKSSTHDQRGRAPSASTPKRRFATVFFAALLLFALLNLCFFYAQKQEKRSIREVLIQAGKERQAKQTLKHTWGWWLAKQYLEQKKAPDVVVFGSSLIGTAHASIDAQYNQKLTDVVTHRRMNYLEKMLKQKTGNDLTVFSLACPGEMISDAYMISRSLFGSGIKPKVVIATIAPRDFVDSTLPFPGVTDPFKFFNNYVSLNGLESAAYPEFFARMGAEMERLPLKHAGKIYTRRDIEVTTSDWDNLDPNRVELGKSMIPANALPPWSDNSKEYIERFRHPFTANYVPEMRFFKAWIKGMKEQGIDVMVVCMPTLEMNRKLLPEKFWTTFRAEVQQVCKDNQADWFDLSDSGLFQQTDYLDTVHLSAYGGLKLFPVLAERATMVPSVFKTLSRKD